MTNPTAQRLYVEIWCAVSGQIPLTSMRYYRALQWQRRVDREPAAVVDGLTAQIAREEKLQPMWLWARTRLRRTLTQEPPGTIVGLDFGHDT